MWVSRLPLTTAAANAALCWRYVGVESRLLDLGVRRRPEGIGEHEAADDEQQVAGEPQPARPRRRVCDRRGGFSTVESVWSIHGWYPRQSAGCRTVLDWRPPTRRHPRAILHRRPRRVARRRRCARDRPPAVVLADRAARGRGAGRARRTRSSSRSSSCWTTRPCWRSSPATRRSTRTRSRASLGVAQVRFAKSREVRRADRVRAGGRAAVRPGDASCRSSPTRACSRPTWCTAAAARRRTMLKIRSADLEALLEPRVLPIAARSDGRAKAGAGASGGTGRRTATRRVQRGHQRTKWRATMTETLTHTIGSAGRLAILSREDLERLDRRGPRRARRRRRRRPVRARPATRSSRRARPPTARASPSPAELVRRLVGLAPAHMTLGARAGAPDRHRRALAHHHRRLLRRDLRPRDRREARDHRGRRRHHQPRRRRAARDRLLLAGRQRPGPAGRGPRPARALPRHRQHRQARADGDRRRARPRRGRRGDGAAR